MKRFFGVVLTLILCLALLAGCGISEAASPTPESTAPAGSAGRDAAPSAAAAADSTAAPGEEPDPAAGRVTVTASTEAEDFYTEDGGRLLLRFACTAPIVTVEGREAASDAINAALEAERRLFTEGGDEQTEYNITGKAAFLDAAREGLAYWQAEGVPDGMAPYMLRRAMEVRRGDERVLSVTFDDTTYLGGAHGYTLTRGFTFDTLTGEALSLSDLAEDGEAFLAACAERLLEAAGGAEYAMAGLDEDYAGRLPGLLRDNNWYFNDDGLVVLANAYEIAPYAAGLISFTLPYAWLRWQIRPEYLPAGAAAGGTLSGAIAEDAPGGAFSLDDGTGGRGAAVVFTARGRVEDVSIHRVTYLEYDNTFRADDILWYAGAMEDGETLCLRTWIPDAAPGLSITWTGESGVPQTFYISQSGMDGSLVLLNADAFSALPLEISRRLPFSYDIDGDGERETLDLVNTGEDGGTRWRLTVDGVPAAGDAYAMDAELLTLWLCDLDADGVAEILFSGDMGSDDYVTCAWRGDTREPLLFTGESRYGKDPAETADTVDGRAVFSGGFLVLESWNYQLGTYAATRVFRLNGDGVIAPAEDQGWAYRRSTPWLTVRRNLPVTLDEVGRAVLTPGETIRLLGSDGDRVRFATGAGETGIITMEPQSAENGAFAGWLIGGEPEDVFFEMLPYVG